MRYDLENTGSLYEAFVEQKFHEYYELDDRYEDEEEEEEEF